MYFVLGKDDLEFPKYTTQIINIANQNAQGTRPSVVGQMSELIQEFSGKSIAEWKKWYIDGTLMEITNWKNGLKYFQNK